MKVALAHDYIKEYGGAERVLEALHEIWPNAPVYTSVYLPEFLGPHKERFANWNIKTSWLQYVPFKHKLISPFRLISPFVFKSFDLSNFDVVIVSATGAYIPNKINCHPEPRLTRRRISLQSSGDSSQASPDQNDNKGRTIHVCYCHTPPRYLYGFATAREWKKNVFFRVIGEIGNHFLRLIDFKSAQNVDYFIANSKNVAGRIKKFYKRDSTVIYPPVDVKDTKILRYKDIKKKEKKPPNILVSQYPNIKNYFLAGGRLARPKHIDLIVRACRELKVPLKIFGRGFGGWGNELKTQNSKIEFVGEVTDEEKLELMRNAKAYIFAGEDEDFGITPVEAMSCGTPVIAYRSGGVVESVVKGKTGTFFDDLTVGSLVKVIKQFSNLSIDPNDCIKQAEKFNKERFKKEIKDFIAEKFKQ